MKHDFKSTAFRFLLMVIVYALITGIIDYYRGKFIWLPVIISSVIFGLIMTLLNRLLAKQKKKDKENH